MNMTAEDVLLNAILTSDFGKGVDQASTIVKAEDFVQEYNRKLWRAMVAVHGKGLPIDCSCLVDQLVADGMKADQAASALARTMDGAALGGYVESYARRVKEASRRHRIAKAVELANLRVVEGEDPVWVKDELHEQLLRLDQDSTEARDFSLREIGPARIEEMVARLNGDQTKSGLMTGIGGLDVDTKGIKAGQLWIVGGMPGRGKSAFALQVALQNIANGVPVYLVSLEMSAGQVWDRLMQMEFGAFTMEDPKRKLQRVHDHAAELQLFPLTICDSSSLRVEEIAARARLAIQRTGTRLVIVDYLQLVNMRGGERREAVGEAANQLRILAKDTQVPVMLLSQLRRPMSINERPSMIDLKESGDIEAHAHVVLLMYRPVEEGHFTGADEIIIGKHRDGPTGKVKVSFEGEYARFK